MTQSSAIIAAPEAPLHRQAKNSSFHLAMLLLPREKRKALLTLYAVCRALDDAVDDAPAPQAAQSALGRWQQELEAVFRHGQPALPLAREFQLVHQRYHFDYADMQAMLAALQQDARGEMRCPTLQALERYCYGVASTVGLMSMRIFSCIESQAQPFAIALGHALQLTNILRDVITDARMNRIYLPIEMLGETFSPESILLNPQSIQHSCAALAQNARHYFAEADLLAQQLPPRLIAPALAMRDVYSLYWRKLEILHWLPPLIGKLPLTPQEKATLAARSSHYLLGKFKPVEL